MGRIAPAAADTRLIRALVADARAHGVVAAVREWTSHPWASVTFEGMRHRGVLETVGSAGADWAAALPDAELRVGGHLVADLVATCDAGGMVAVEALTLRQD